MPAGRTFSGRAPAGALLIALALLAVPWTASSETVSALPSNHGFATVQEILTATCSACHDWTGSYESVIAGGRIIAGDPDKSILYQKIATDEMPQAGDKLTADQKAFIKGWISAGAPNNDLPIAVPAAQAAPSETAAAAPSGSAAAAAKAPASTSFLLFPNKATFHAVTGFTSAALFLGAGVIGVIHLVDMMDAGHAWRDANNWNEDTSPEYLRVGEIKTVWGDQSTLCWVHVGLIVAGETLYIGDAITGISMMTLTSQERSPSTTSTAGRSSRTWRSWSPRWAWGLRKRMRFQRASTTWSLGSGPRMPSWAWPSPPS